MALSCGSRTVWFSRPCLWPISKSLKSWAGVIFNAPVPNLGCCTMLHCRMPRRSIRKPSPIRELSESSRARLAINIGIGNDRDASALWHPVTSCDLRPNEVHQGPHQATSPSWKWVPDPEWAPRRPGQWGACSDHPAIFSPLTDCCVDAYLSILNPIFCYHCYLAEYVSTYLRSLLCSQTVSSLKVSVQKKQTPQVPYKVSVQSQCFPVEKIEKVWLGNVGSLVVSTLWWHDSHQFHPFPTSGWTQTAESPRMVSGLVVATGMNSCDAERLEVLEPSCEVTPCDTTWHLGWPWMALGNEIGWV